jgi:hypothetical protein
MLEWRLLSDATIKRDGLSASHTTMQYNIIAYATVDTERDVFCGYEIVVYRLRLVCGVSSCWEIAKEGPVDGVSS